MNRLLHFLQSWCRIMVSLVNSDPLWWRNRLELNTGLQGAFCARYGKPTNRLTPPIPRTKGAFAYNRIHPHKTPAPVGAGQGRGTLAKEAKMQPDSTSDPRRFKALLYLKRIRKYCESPHAAVYDTWAQIRHHDHIYTEVTTKNVNICRAIRYAVRVLGGQCYTPRLRRGWYEDLNTGEADRHVVIVMRFTLPE